MKTKINPQHPATLKIIMVLPFVIMALVIFTSCATRKKSALVQTELAPPPPQLPPPPPPPSTKPQQPTNQSLVKEVDTNVTVSEKPLSPEDEDIPYVVVEQMPIFSGGDSALLAYITNNTHYPDSAKVKNIQGKVIVRFCVTREGGVDRVSVLRGVDPDLDLEALRVVETLPEFKPGKQGGKPVNVWYMVPITFTLK